MKQNPKSRFGFYLVLSLLFHGLLFIFIYYSKPLAKRPQAPAPKVVFLEAEDILKTPLTIVDTPKPELEQVPDKARFASNYNNKVQEETVAPSLPEKAKLSAETSDGSDKKDQLASAPKKKEDKKDLKNKPEKIKKISEQASPKDLKLKPSDVTNLEGPEKASTSQGKQGADEFVHDYLPGIKIGNKTYLNTQAMPNVQYFTRLKRIFRLRFNPTEALRQHFQYNRVVVAQVNTTLGVEVHADGSLKKAFVIKSSGINAYDKESLLTVRQSAPFSRPPQNLLAEDGVLRMTWHFTTYL
ncbi:MAG: energy transducer TonB [Deltaproteobacteria bacterium]|nr:energy transducer TonB [Deltaproteobacteria bacterium]